MYRKLFFLMGFALVVGLVAEAATAGECDNWQAVHPEWIFCDDFEDGTAFVRQGRYFEYGNDGGDFVPLDGIGVDSSTGMRVIFQNGEVSAGGFKLGFGRNPNGYMNRGIRDTEDFRDIYYRMYLKMQPGWAGSPGKLSRATSFSSSTDWSQAMIAHLWSSGDYLLVDPVRCVDPATSLVKCIGYNDFAHMDWIGNQRGATPIFDSLHDGIWYCVEHHVRLNDPGQANGIQEFWIDGNLEARRDGLDFVVSYTDYAINAIFFENYWNSGSPQVQERYFDNVVVSTQPIGSLDASPPGQASNPNPAYGATDISIDADLSWTAGSGSVSSDVYFGTDSTPDAGEFQGNQTGTTFDPGTMANDTTYYWRVDEVNAEGTTTGVVWSFTTEAAPVPPGQATNPSPADGAADVSVDAELSWAVGSGADSHDVYFGTSSPGSFQGNQTGTIFDPGTMANDTTYYWRVDEVNAEGTTAGVVWSFTTEAAPVLPGQATNPSPADDATDISINADLSWTAGTDSTSSDVYFGTDSTPDAGEFQGNQTGTTFDPGTLANGATYYWRIDEVNAAGTTTGVVWIFTTEAAPVPLPGQAANPSPADDATDVGIDTELNWTAGADSTSSDVYFGTTSPGSFQGNQAGTTFDPGTLANETTYYWRIDEVNAAGTTTGVVWIFTTEAAPVPLPGQAANPSPADGATDISVDADLSWAAGSGADSHNVYFGTDPTPDGGESQGNQTAVTFDPGTLANGTTYYWRIDEVNAGGTTAGVVWSFTTEAPSGDVVTITKAEFRVRKSQLTVEARSSQGGTAVLTVQGYGTMTYNKKKNKYKFTQRRVTDPGGTITVTSSLGGSETVSVTYK